MRLRLLSVATQHELGDSRGNSNRVAYNDLLYIVQQQNIGSRDAIKLTPFWIKMKCTIVFDFFEAIGRNTGIVVYSKMECSGMLCVNMKM